MSWPSRTLAKLSISATQQSFTNIRTIVKRGKSRKDCCLSARISSESTPSHSLLRIQSRVLSKKNSSRQPNNLRPTFLKSISSMSVDRSSPGTWMKCNAKKSPLITESCSFQGQNNSDRSMHKPSRKWKNSVWFTRDSKAKKSSFDTCWSSGFTWSKIRFH